MTALPEGPLIAWYGDDFTGSAATMEALTFAGLPAVLFFDVPTAAQLARFPGSARHRHRRHRALAVARIGCGRICRRSSRSLAGDRARR